MTAGTAPLAPQWDAQLRDLAALIDAAAESAAIASARGTADRAVLHWLINANRLIARAARREPVTP
jgi:hypothetical protein